MLVLTIVRGIVRPLAQSATMSLPILFQENNRNVNECSLQLHPPQSVPGTDRQ